MSINYFPFHIGDFLSGTMHMDGTEIGAYMMLIIAHYQIGVEGLPNDDKALARISKLTLKQWMRVREVVLEKFTLTDSKWRSSKCVEVLSQINSKSADQKAKALKRWNTDDATALPKQSHPKANNQKPKISSNEDIHAPRRISSLEDLEKTIFDEHHRGWFEENTPSVQLEGIREELVLYCRSKGKRYKDYWATMQTWARRKEQENGKQKSNGSTGGNRHSAMLEGFGQAIARDS